MTTSPSIISRDRLLAVAPWAVALAILGYAFVVGGYLVTVMSFALIYAVFVIGLNLFMGYAGQVTFGHNAFPALGGYGSAVLPSPSCPAPPFALPAPPAALPAPALLTSSPPSPPPPPPPPLH